jgi:hypothetical protein
MGCSTTAWWCCRTIHCVNQSRHPCCLWPFDHLMTLGIVLRSDWLLVQGVSINACSQARSFETLRDRFNEWYYTVQCRRKELAIVTKSWIISTFRETCLATETDTGSWHGRVLHVAMSHENCLRQAYSRFHKSLHPVIEGNGESGNRTLSLNTFATRTKLPPFPF